MKKALFIIIIGLSACSAKDNQENVSTDTTSKFKKINAQEVDTLKKLPVKQKSFEQKADDRLDKIMNKRKYVK
ncbi:hypothetical protein ACFOWA_06670 [Pedobacter lithocola]|uniref:Lipoprotein n=1 Tax=Pedobacter lithocola TaxID=1908239 RepID=A0ABV8P6E5_9SPHI